MSAPEVREGQRIRWTGKNGTVVEGVVDGIGVVSGTMWMSDGIAVRADGTVEVLPDPEPTVPGTVVRDAVGGLWGRHTDGEWAQLSDNWFAARRWAAVPQPVTVLFTPEADQ